MNDQTLDARPLGERLAACRSARARRALLDEREALIHSCLAMVCHLATRFMARNNSLSYADLVGAGHVGLVLAADKYRPNRKATFATYAYTAIWSHLVREAKRQRGQSVSVPDSAWKSANPDVVAAVERAQQAPVSMDYVYRDGMESQFGRKEPEPLYEVDEREALREQLRFLPKPWRRVVELRYFAEWRLEDIGQEMGLSKERIRQILLKAMARLRQRLRQSLRVAS